MRPLRWVERVVLSQAASRTAASLRTQFLLVWELLPPDYLDVAGANPEFPSKESFEFSELIATDRATSYELIEPPTRAYPGYSEGGGCRDPSKKLTSQTSARLS